MHAAVSEVGLPLEDLESNSPINGEVTSCWVPPVEARRKETAWVKPGPSLLGRSKVFSSYAPESERGT